MCLFGLEVDALAMCQVALLLGWWHVARWYAVASYEAGELGACGAAGSVVRSCTRQQAAATCATPPASMPLIVVICLHPFRVSIEDEQSCCHTLIG